MISIAILVVAIAVLSFTFGVFVAEAFNKEEEE